MPEFLQYGFMQRALLVGVITALICPAIGVFLVPRRLSLVADSLAHVALAGVALALVLGISPTLGALGVTVGGAWGIERLRARGRLQGDAALAVFLSGGFAIAVVLISLARGFNANLFALLFGSILTVSPSDVWLILALGVLVAMVIGGLYSQLLAITLNEDLARTSGIRVAALNLGLTVLTALTTVVAMRIVGVLLVSAMIVIPVLTGFALARSFRGALAAAIGAALVSVVTGLVAAYYLELAAGGAIVLSSLALFGAASLHGGAARAASRSLGGLLVVLVSLPLVAAGSDADCPRWRVAFRGMPSRTAQVVSGDRSLAVAVKLADTDECRAAGFQCATAGEIRTSVIVFDFGQELLTQFHIRNVPAFAKADGRIFAILRMAPSPTALYGPMGPLRCNGAQSRAL